MNTRELYFPNSLNFPVLVFFILPLSLSSEVMLSINSFKSLIFFIKSHVYLTLYLFLSYINFFLGCTLSSENSSFYSTLYFQDSLQLFHITGAIPFSAKSYFRVQNTSIYLFIFPLMNIQVDNFSLSRAMIPWHFYVCLLGCIQIYEILPYWFQKLS